MNSKNYIGCIDFKQSCMLSTCNLVEDSEEYQTQLFMNIFKVGYMLLLSKPSF